ncbi:MAG: SCO family protein [Candidatus Schekmanbacteria bacterium]|nr:SCO family protein [Candidatus Schekmanbacteria bacterium]
MIGESRESYVPLGLLGAWIGITVSWWILALAPLPPAAPEWLLRTRTVCFGTLSNGLPDAYGWIVLLVGPAGMLGALVAIWWRELRANFRSVSVTAAGRAVLALFVLVPAAASAWLGPRVAAGLRVPATFLEVSPAPETLPADYPMTDKEGIDFSLVDQHGAEVGPRKFSGRLLFLTFAFAHCQSMCPLIVHTTKRAIAEIPELNPVALIVTLDPWRDTPSSLPTMAGSFGLSADSPIHVLSGAVDSVEKVLDTYEVPRDRDDKSGEIVHPALVYVIAPSGRIAYTLNNASGEWLAEAGRRAVRLQ